jgi:hypothetical protein
MKDNKLLWLVLAALALWWFGPAIKAALPTGSGGSFTPPAATAGRSYGAATNATGGAAAAQAQLEQMRREWAAEQKRLADEAAYWAEQDRVNAQIEQQHAAARAANLELEKAELRRRAGLEP